MSKKNFSFCRLKINHNTAAKYAFILEQVAVAKNYEGKNVENLKRPSRKN
jgi:hypothetical protein